VNTRAAFRLLPLIAAELIIAASCASPSTSPLAQPGQSTPATTTRNPQEATFADDLNDSDLATSRAITMQRAATPTPTPFATATSTWESQCVASQEDEQSEWVVVCPNDGIGFEIRLPQDAQLPGWSGNFSSVGPDHLVKFRLPVEPGSALFGKSVQVILAEPQGGECPYEGWQEEKFPSGQLFFKRIAVGGEEFVMAESLSAAVARVSLTRSYWVSRDGVCVVLQFVTDFSTVESPAPTPNPAELVVFDEILRSFRWLDPEAAPRPTVPASPTTAALPPLVYTPIGEPIARLGSGDPLVITYISMIDRMAGWAIGGEEPQEHVLRTTDGGGTWIDVTPAIPVRQESSYPQAEGILGFYFLDQETAWIVGSPGITFWFTADGGLSWAPRPFLESPECCVYLPTFLDETHGWFIREFGGGAGRDFAALYATRDGGETWAAVVDDRDADFMPYSPNGLAFADADTGLMTYSEWAVPFEGLGVARTQDGGRIWETLMLVLDGPYPELEFCSTSYPILFSPGQGILAVRCSGDSPQYVFRTKDGGLTWIPAAYPGGALEFVNEDIGWALGYDIYKTIDGGQTWEHLKRVTWEGQFSFVDEQHGWAVATSVDEIALVKTMDGGETWQQMEPTVKD